MQVPIMNTRPAQGEILFIALVRLFFNASVVRNPIRHQTLSQMSFVVPLRTASGILFRPQLHSINLILLSHGLQSSQSGHAQIKLCRIITNEIIRSNAERVQIKKQNTEEGEDDKDE